MEVNIAPMGKQSRKKGKEISKPVCVQQYNRCMKSVDWAD
jgi:hypothetical protein